VDGEVYFDRSRDLEHRKEIEARRKALLEKEQQEKKKGETP
jgi:hypothetical protein